VQTQQVAQIADITAEDCKTVETAMTKCSKWLPGHDQAAAARADIPEPVGVVAVIGNGVWRVMTRQVHNVCGDGPLAGSAPACD